MSERRRILVLTLIMTMACASVIGIALFLTYRTHFAEERERLAVTAQSQARLIEAMARFDAEHSSDYAGGSEEATLSQIIDAHENFVGFGETGEFTLARSEGDLIVFQFRHRHGEVETPDPVPMNSDLAEPMRRALSGLSGTMIGLDYRGTMVLAAHEPVAELNMGIVAKIDLSEVRAPFIRAAFIASGLALLIVAISVVLFRRISNPIIARLEASLKGQVDERKRADERLRIAQYAIDHASDSLALIDLDGKFVYVNESMSRRIGYSTEELLSMGVWDIDPELPAEAWPNHWADLKKEGSLTLESRHRTKDGRVFPVEIVASYGEFGGREYIFAHARDITERKQAEAALERASQEWTLAMDAFEDVIYLLDNDRRVLRANAALYELTGATPETVIGRHIVELIHPEGEAVPCSVCLAQEEKRDFVMTMEPDDPNNSTGRPMEITVKIVRDKDESPSGILMNLHDLTSARAAQGTLRESEEKYRNLVEMSQDLIWKCDSEGRFTYLNRAWEDTLGYTEAEMLGLKFVEFKPPDVVEKNAETFRNILEGTKALGYETVYVSKSGERKTLLFNAQVARDASGSVLGTQGTAHDITERKRAEEKIGFLSQLTEQVADAFISTDLDYRITYVNRAFEELYGYSREEIIGLSPDVLNAEPDFEMIQKQIYEIVASGKTWRSEALNRHKDGSTFPIEMVIFPLLDERGRTFAYAGTLRDITERKRSEEALRVSEEKYRILVERNPYGIQETDAYGTITFVNEMHQEMYGYGKEHLIGRSMTEFMKPGPQRDELPGYLDMLANDQPLPTIYRQTILTKDGRERSIDVCWNYRRDATGSVTGFISVLTDVTARMRAEEALKEQMQLTQILLDSMPCIALLLRPHSREIVAMNQAARDAGAALGKTCFATWPKFSEPCPWCMAPEQWASGKEHHVEVEGLGVTWDAHWIPVSDDLYMHYAFDITERKRAEQQTEDSLREKEVLLREIHHRVKNNMQVIVSLLRMHARRSQSPQIQEIFEDCQERVGAMALVHETLYQSEDLARIDFEVYLEKLCQNMVRAHGGGLGAISVVPEATDVSLGIDQAVAVGMVVGELVSNAFKHAFPGGREGRVTVSMREAGEHEVELVVEDNGVGLPPDVDPENTDTLGLKLVTATATGELGGTMEITRGDGTRFTLRFKNKAV